MLAEPHMARKRWPWVVGGISLAVFIVAAIIVGYRIPFSSDRLRREIIKTLSERLESQVELASLELHPFPRLRAVGGGLVIRHKRHPEVALITIQKFTVNADLAGLLRKHVAHVALEGLAIQIPPKDHQEDTASEASASNAAAPATDRPSTRAGDQASASGQKAPGMVKQLVIDDLVANESTFTLIPRDPEKQPKIWQMHELSLQSVGLNQAMPFTSKLTNAVPPGEIDTTGHFGPWSTDEPGVTPIDGTFTFDHADLGVFKGISGILSAQGSYGGTLGRIQVDGETDTPDFTVKVSGHPVPLKTKYRAIVDGTNGDTTLERIDASFLKTSLVATGGVYDVKGVKGREVKLDITMDQARLEDVLRMAVKSAKTPMTGALTLKTRFELPPGDRDVVDKLQLKGNFTIKGGQFTDTGVQQKINSLSGKARGKGAEEKVTGVTSDFRGTFTLGNGRLALAPLRFDIPGALVEITGQYALRPGDMAFAGFVMMDAKVSQTVGGWKSIVLKVFDPIFNKDGRTFIPITIKGNRNDPKFGVDVKRMFNKDAPVKPPPLESTSAASKKSTPKSAASKNAAPKNATPKNAAPKSAAPKSTAPKSAAPKSTAPKAPAESS
jgi:hypothetical protein